MAGDAPMERLVLYRCGDGRAFARKHVDYRLSRTAPSHALVDARSDHREGLERDGDRVFLYSAARRVALSAADGAALVADAGFDEFLRLHWGRLQDTPRLPMRFAAPTMGRTLSLEVRQGGEARIDGVAVTRYRLSLPGVLSRIGPAITASYRSDSRELRRYEGPSNLRADDGRPLPVVIDFPQRPRSAGEDRWAILAAAPLASCALGR